VPVGAATAPPDASPPTAPPRHPDQRHRPAPAPGRIGGAPQAELEPERRSLVQAAVDADAPAHQLGELLDDRQAEAAAAVAARARRVDLREGVEHRVELVLGDADAGVAHLEAKLHRVVALAEDGDVEDDAAALGELDRVVEQVDEHLAQAHRIALDESGRRHEIVQSSVTGLPRAVVAIRSTASRTSARRSKLVSWSASLLASIRDRSSTSSISASSAVADWCAVSARRRWPGRAACRAAARWCRARRSSACGSRG
jgi:hypothetical protein